MDQKTYYTAPPQEIFEEIKRIAIGIWGKYDDTYGYATEKINAIKDLENVSDNAWYMVAMFDGNNQSKMLSMASPKTKMMILDAINS